jgi:hypothetical protein
MRIAACTVVAVLGISLDGWAQGPHSLGKSDFGHQQWQNGNGQRAAFASQDFKVGLSPISESAPASASSTSRGGRTETPVVQIDLSMPSPRDGRRQIPDCVAR